MPALLAALVEAGVAFVVVGSSGAALLGADPDEPARCRTSRPDAVGVDGLERGR
jgi:hypothetical protein